MKKHAGTVTAHEHERRSSWPKLKKPKAEFQEIAPLGCCGPSLSASTFFEQRIQFEELGFNAIAIFHDCSILDCSLIRSTSMK